jgi:hypothetical protein
MPTWDPHHPYLNVGLYTLVGTEHQYRDPTRIVVRGFGSVSFESPGPFEDHVLYECSGVTSWLEVVFEDVGLDAAREAEFSRVLVACHHKTRHPTRQPQFE